MSMPSQQHAKLRGPSDGRPPRHCRPREAGRFQDFIIEAKALTGPNTEALKAGSPPAGRRKAKTARPFRLLAQGHSWVSAQDQQLPLRMSVTPASHVDANRQCTGQIHTASQARD